MIQDIFGEGGRFLAVVNAEADAIQQEESALYLLRVLEEGNHFCIQQAKTGGLPHSSSREVPENMSNE